MLERIIIVFIRNKFNDYKYYWKKYFIIPKIISFGVELRLINTQYVAIIFREDYNSFERKERKDLLKKKKKNKKIVPKELKLC